MNEVRLIDAEALKKALHNFFDGKVIDEPTYILRDVFYHIDNAPTPFDPTVITCNTNALSNEEIEKLIKSIQSARIVPDNLQGWRYEETSNGKGAERALSIIDRLYTEGHINNMEQGVLRRAILLPEKGGAT